MHSSSINKSHPGKFTRKRIPLTTRVIYTLHGKFTASSSSKENITPFSNSATTNLPNPLFKHPLSSFLYSKTQTPFQTNSSIQSIKGPCESVINMSGINGVNSIDTDGSSNHHEQHHIMSDTGAEESARADLEAGKPGPIAELPDATPADQPAGGVAAVGPQMNRDSGLLPNLSTAAVSASLVAVVRPTPKGLHSHKLLTVAYTCDVITLLVLGILLYGLTFALDAVPDKWLGAVRAIMTAVAIVLLLLLLLFAAFVGYGLIFLDIHH